MRPSKQGGGGRCGRPTRDPAADEVADLEARIAAGAPPRGSDAGLPPPPPPHPPRAGAPPPPTPLAGRRHFKDLPLSRPTLAGLAAAGYDRMTAIQRTALPHALAGRDVLGAAKTGSGKTLAFLIPLLEALYRARWTRLDGLGALVLVPTRELAHQVFGELAKVGKHHAFSAGLLIGGGSSVGEEAARLARLHILVATPGRLLQHADESPGWEPSGLRVLVLDEADRLLDMGFAPTLDALVAGLPASGRRQTLLFSATQTKSVRALARLALADPERADVHAGSATPTPLRLKQAWAAVPAPAKADVVWAFLRSHPASRTIVFLATCKQVRFFQAAFCRLRPGVPLRALHGGMKQGARAAAVSAFAAAPGGAALLATDVAARGLDFPSIDWVLQADCPDDVEAYIHRVGRAARYVRSGRALLLLTPGEAPGMGAALAGAGVPISEARLNPGKASPVSPALAALLSKDADLKAQAQRAVSSYLRSVALQPNKAIFDLAALPAAAYAASLGLATAPRVAKWADAVRKKREAEGMEEEGGGGEEAGGASSSEGEEGDGEEGGGGAGVTPPTPAPAAAAAPADVSDDDDDLLVVKTADIFSAGGDGGGCADADADPAALVPGGGGEQDKKRKKKRLRIDPRGGSSAAVPGGRVVFDEDGAALPPLALLGRPGGGIGEGGEGEEEEEDEAGGPPRRQHGLDVGPHASAASRLAAARAALAARDGEDRAAYAAERKRRRKEKAARARAREEDGEESERDGEEESAGGPPPPPSPPRALLPEPAHKGMARKSAAAGASDGYVPSTLAETEALALALLRARAGG